MSREFRRTRRPSVNVENWVLEYWAETSLDVTVTVAGRNKVSDAPWYPEFFIQSHLYDVFVALNLALPGSADFLGVRLIPKDGPPTKTELSAFYFEKAFRSNQWPKLEALPSEQALRWYHRVR